jgi:hypothetical protein
MFFCAFVPVVMLSLSGCSNKQGSEQVEEQQQEKPSKITKAVSSSGASLVIEKRAVVFFNPDSIQLESFRSATNKQTFETMKHDCFFQMRNARNVLKRSWPGIRIKEVRDTRYLLFVKEDGNVVRYDLDSLDLCGMVLFDPVKDPVIADMMNVETELGFYFSKQ